MTVKREDRRAAITAYKNRIVPAGIYAMRCATTGQCWVGKALDMGAARNRLRFTLSQGLSPHRSLQDAWRRHGEASFSFEPVEALEDDLSDYVRERTLSERLEHWQAALQAEAI
ncbi:MAG: GIY-YIG nuclease family protein [Pseudomonadales bacterium]